MLIGSAFILALSLGVRHGFGLYLVPMSHEFSWSHQVFSLAIAIQNLFWGAVQICSTKTAQRFLWAVLLSRRSICHHFKSQK